MTSRQVVYAILNLLLALLTLMGVNLSEEMRQIVVTNVETILVACLAMNGVIVWILRAITKTPLVGMFTKQEER